MAGDNSKTNKEKTASARVEGARISLKHSKIICSRLRKSRVDKAKALLEGLIAKRASLDGKYYTSASKKMLEILGSAEANATAKGLDAGKLFIKVVKADKGRTFMRPRSRSKLRRQQAKSSNVEIILEERQ
jgi:ribosomal protein L22